MNLHFINISDLKSPEVSIYSQYKENQLVHYNEPELGLFIVESPKVIFRALDAGYEPVSFLVEDKTIESREASELWEKLRGMSSQEDFRIPVYVGDMKLLSQITGFKLTRGVLSAMKRKKLPDAKELCKDFCRIAVLENVVNPTNVGAIFRSAAALNIDAVLLTSGCSDPLYRRAARVSMGTVFQIPWTYISSERHFGKTASIAASVSEDKSHVQVSASSSEESFSGQDISGDEDFHNEKPFWPERGMKLLKSMGFKTAAMALRDRSVSIDHLELIKEPKLAVILGTEGEGLMNETIETSDYVVKIPMSHGVDSLNVAAASAVVFWQLGQKGVQGF